MIENTCQLTFKTGADALLNILGLLEMNPFAETDLRLMSCFKSEQLTPSQKKCIEALDDFFRSDRDVFFLQGGAGTGKTFLVKGISAFISQVQDPRIRRNDKSCCHALVAPTGRAAFILSTKTGVHASTLHSFVYDFEKATEFRETNLDGSESVRFRFEIRTGSLERLHVSIVDEASMVGDRFSRHERLIFGSGQLLTDYVAMTSLGRNRSHHKAIFVGDPFQLPPVGETFSPAFDADYLLEQFGIRTSQFELTDVVRQRASSNVLKQAQHLRACLEKASFHFNVQTGGDLVDARQVLDLPEHWKARKGSLPPENRILLVHSNKEALKWNQVIRTAYFENTNGPQVGDLVLIAKNVETHCQKLYNGQIFRCIETPGEVIHREVKLRRKRDEKVEIIGVSLRWQYVTLQLIGEGEKRPPIKWPLLLNSLEFDHAGVEDDFADALYVDFKIRHPTLTPNSRAFSQTLKDDAFFNGIQARYGYAITVHKAQGGEWPHVYVDMGVKTMKSKDDFQWAYTAFTRTSDKLYLLRYPKPTQVNWAVPEVGKEAQTIVLKPEDFPDGTAHPAQSPEALLAAAKKLLKEGGLSPSGHRMMQYQIRIFFGLNQLNLNYNGDFEFTKVNGHEPAVQLLRPWMKKPIRVEASEETAQEDWNLKASHATIPLHADRIIEAMRERLDGTGVEIEEVNRQPYAIVISAKRGGSEATFRIHHRANGSCSTQMRMESNDPRMDSLFAQAYNLQLR